MKRGIYFLLSVVLLATLLAAGCQVASPSSSQGGTLNLYAIDPITLDPAVSGEMTSHDFIVQIFNGLVLLDDKLEPAPDIAEKWQVSKDGLTYTFSLRKDVKFQDGRKLTAADFKYSWERACNPATGSLTAATYLGDIAGTKQVLSGKATDISGVKVIDDYTLQVTIDAPKAYFLAKLTYPTAFVVDKANVESGKNWWRQPNGTGPFKLKTWTQNTSLVLVKNDLSYDPARVNTVNYELYAGVPMNLYETGQIDAADISSAFVYKVTDKSGPFYQQLSIVPELSFNYIGFNTTKPPFDDANVRRAFTQAINKERLVSLVFSNTMQAAYGILPPGMPGYNDKLKGIGFDANAAKESIAKSKYGSVDKLPPITITTSGWGGDISGGLAAIVQEWKTNLGVDVKVRQLEPDYFIYHLKDEKDEMFISGWIADYPHPQDFLDILFHTGQDNNYGEYSNPAVDSILEMAAVEPDATLSQGLYQQAEQKLVDDAASIPLWFGKNYVLTKPYVDDYNINPLGFAMLNKVSVRPH